MGTNSPTYQAQYRAENPDYVRIQKQRASARTAAMRRLREKYADDFTSLFAEELKRYGLKP